jgi:CRISPR-associated protein Csd1
VLRELVEYAERHGLNVTPGLKSKSCDYVIVLTDDGRFVDVTKEERVFGVCPHLEQPELVSGSSTKSQFLLDKLSTVTCYKAKGKDEEKHDYFVYLLKEASVIEPMLLKCAQVVEDKEQLELINEKLSLLKAKATDSVTFRVGSVYPVELTTWHEWWNEYRAFLKSQKPAAKRAKEADSQAMICLMSGRLTVPEKTHPKVNLASVGGQSAGSSLISFDKDAFRSYDLDQSWNAACSPESTAAYTNALSHLTENSRLRVGNNLIVYWYKEQVSKEYDLLDLDAFGDDDEVSATQQVRKILEDLREGNLPSLVHNMYYIMQISANGGRIMVRDWLFGDFSELIENIHKWFEDTQIVGSYGTGLRGGFKFSAAVLRLVPYRPQEKNPLETLSRASDTVPMVVSNLYRSIVTGTSFPDNLASSTLAHIRSKVYRNDSDRRSANLDDISCALLKAWLVRNRKDNGGVGVDVGLNPNHPAAAYQVGRLMAVLDDIQYSALGDVGADVVQKFYATASTAPALVVGRIVKMAQYHLGKLSPGLAYYYEKTLAEIFSKITDVPKTLSLEEQALFALGFYQQKAELLKGKVQNKKETEQKEEE